jgi:hypothetical protein
MPRGSQPGERRGGRKKGTPNKKTLRSNIVAIELAKNPDLDPLELFLGLMRSPRLSLDARIDMARHALPYFQAKPRPAPPVPQLRDGGSLPRVKLRLKTEEEELELDDEWLGLGCDREASQPLAVGSFRTIAANEAASLQAVDNTREHETESLLRSDDPITAGPEITAPPGGSQAGTALKKVGPMTFLRAIMLHPKTPLDKRLKVASILAPYLHAKRTAGPPGEKSFELEDQFGFTVDPQLAKRVRDLARQCGLLKPVSLEPFSRDEWIAWIDAAAERLNGTAQKRDAKLAEEKKKLRCAPNYGREDVSRDWQRLRHLAQIRKARPLTPEEDAEEIHLTARKKTAEYAEREALDNKHRALLEKRDKLYEKWKDCTLSKNEQQEFDRLRAILNTIDADSVHADFRDPVYSDFSHQLCMEARIRGMPKPSQEEVGKRLAELESSVDIVRQNFRPPKRAPAEPKDVDLTAWLRGEVSYPPWLLRKAAPDKYCNAPIELIMIGLVRDENRVSEFELSAYFAWLLWLYDEELRLGNNPAANLRAMTPTVPSLRTSRPTGPLPWENNRKKID